MSETRTYTNYWKPQLLDTEKARIESLGLRGAKINGNPYTTHLKYPGKEHSLCGKRPGGNNARKMTARAYWALYGVLEGPGRPLCEKCLAAVPGKDTAS